MSNVDFKSYANLQTSYSTGKTNAHNKISNISINNKATANGDAVTFKGKQTDKKKPEDEKKEIQQKSGIASLASKAVYKAAIAPQKIGAAVLNAFEKIDFNLPSSSKDAAFKKVKPESIIIPENGYDLSKEPTYVIFDYLNDVANTHYSHTVNAEDMDPKDKERMRMLYTFAPEIGITADGHAFVRIKGEMQALSNRKYADTDKDRLCGITLISDSKEFTPAQKNLIALMQQRKLCSENSPIALPISDIMGENPTRENIFDLIAKWSQDIDVSNSKTQAVLGRLSIIKEDEATNVSKLEDNDPLSQATYKLPPNIIHNPKPPENPAIKFYQED